MVGSENGLIIYESLSRVTYHILDNIGIYYNLILQSNKMFILNHKLNINYNER